ncbi:MAG: cyclohydrolase, partial [Burkholderiaceae bacterium]|nr:cyclohydrolase [Burkholderiaceae bacterium]
MNARTPPSGSADATDLGVPVSQKIRERLEQAKHRFHANDCIAPYIQADELPLLQEEVEGKL